MFFDFSSRKSLLLGSIALALAILIAAFVTVNNRTGFLPRAGEIIAMEQGRLTYLVFYEIPSFFDPLPEPAYAAGNAIGVPVLLYHGEGAASSAMPLSVFVDQMRTLYENGWRTITYQQFLDFEKNGTPVPAKSFLLTFDDGRRDTFYSVDPVLQDLHFTAVMFVITQFSMPDNSDAPLNGFYLSKAELAYMQQSGRWELESHGGNDHREYDVPTATSTAGDVTLIPEQHFLSNEFWLPDDGRLETESEFDTRVTEDLTDAKKQLDQDFGINVSGFAYPFNDYGEDSENFPGSQSDLNTIVPQIYSLAFYQVSAGEGDSFNYPEPQGYFMKRIEPPATWSGGDLLHALGGGVAKTLPYRATFGDDWTSDWGTATTSPTGLILRANPDTDGAASFLDGTESWTDYTITTTFSSTFGTVSLIARHRMNNEPYLVCAFANDKIYLEEHVGENQITLVSAPYALGNVTNPTVSMTVDGNTASCNAYGAHVSGGALGILNGGIGVEIWDPENGTASTTVTALSVAPVSP